MEMTDKKKTEIVFIMDRSGSMDSVVADAIGGFNAFLKEQQKNKEDKCLLTYVQFDTEGVDTVHECKPIEDVPPLNTDTFVPRGGTPLIYAMCKTIDDVGRRLKNVDEDKRPGNVIVVTLTDGEENASNRYNTNEVKYTNELLKSKIEKQSDHYDWTFMFLMQNSDAFAAAGNMGINMNHPKHFVGNMMKGARGQQAAYFVASAAVGQSRKRAARGMSTDFAAEEKEAYTSGLLGDDKDMKNLNISETSGDSSSTTDSSSK